MEIDMYPLSLFARRCRRTKKKDKGGPDTQFYVGAEVRRRYSWKRETNDLSPSYVHLRLVIYD